MTSRERVMKALNFEETDRIPMDLAGMRSTGISCFAYPALVEALGLAPRPPRVYDTGQMLALPDLDVLDALETDIVTVEMDITNALEQPDRWQDVDFGGRLAAKVLDAGMFKVLDDGSVVQPANGALMPPTSHVFETEHGGQPLMLSGEIPKPDLDMVRKQCEDSRLTSERVAEVAQLLRRVREQSDRAVFFAGPGAGIGIANFTGIAMFPMLCLTEPDFVRELHDIVVDHAVQQLETLLPAIHPYIDIILVSADDWGTQNHTVSAPETYEQLFLPYYRRVNDTIHQLAPEVKTFLHSCGAIYNLIDLIVESGFDALNPVQWSAGTQGYREWKDKARGRITLWGGGVNSQATLPLGSIQEIEAEVAEVVSYMKKDGGYVFCGIHNILAEIPGDKVVSLYRTAAGI